jgi:hypothetical protein
MKTHGYQIHCLQFVNKVRRIRVLYWAFRGRQSSALWEVPGEGLYESDGVVSGGDEMDMDMLLFEFGLLVIVGIVLLAIFRRS